MQVYDPKALQEKFGGRQIKVDQHFLKQTSLITNQTLLKLGEYNLICIPAYITFEEVQLLAVLTPSEVSLFSKYTSTTNTLVMCFSNPEDEDVARFHIRVNLLGINPLAERKNICLLSVKYKTVPAELIQILGSYFEDMDNRHAAYERYAEEIIEMTADSAQLMGYNNYAELLFEGRSVKVKLKAFSSKKALLLLPAGGEDLVGKKPIQLKLYFKTAQFSAPGELKTVDEFALDFSNELVNIVEDYLFRTTMTRRKKSDEA